MPDAPSAASVAIFTWLPELQLPLSFAEAFAHPDPEVRRAAVRLFGPRQTLPPFDELASLVSQEPNDNVRAFLCLVAAEAGEPGRPVAEALEGEADTFVRLRARLQLNPLAAPEPA